MQALIHQARLHGLRIPIRGSSMAPGHPVELALDPDYIVAAFVTLPSRLPFGLGRATRKHLGYLDPQVAEKIAPAIEKQAVLRVRIVEIEPAHARTDVDDRISISVWGEPDALPVPRPERERPRDHPARRDMKVLSRTLRR